MIQTDGHDNGDQRPRDHIGGVEPAAKPYLQRHDVAFFFIKPAESQGGIEFKFRNEKSLLLQSKDFFLNLLNQTDERIFPDPIPVYL